MAENQRWQAIPTQLDLAAFEQFVLPHLSPGSRGPARVFAPERGAELGVTRRAARAVALADLDPELHRLPLGIPAGVLGKVKNMVPDRAISSANVL